PRRVPNEKLEKRMRQNVKQTAILLDDNQREVVRGAIAEVCKYRGYDLKAINVRTNHAHAVVSAQSKPEPIINAFKSYSTRKLREPDYSAWRCARGHGAGVGAICGNLGMFRALLTMSY